MLLYTYFYARASQLLREVFGLQVSAGSLVGWVRTCSQALIPVEARIKEGWNGKRFAETMSKTCAY